MHHIKAVVGIFSREDPSTYDWLIRFLLSSSAVKDVRPVYIHRESCNLSHEIQQCTFAILYHTKNRGRLNVTDVPDSLYDRELELLHQNLGRKNVIVVIDDVDDSSDAMKTQILTIQPGIGDWAEDLFIFSSQDKEFAPVSYENQKWLHTWRERKQITKLIKAHNRRLLIQKLRRNYKIILLLFVLLLVFYLIVVTCSMIAQRKKFNNQNTTVSPGNITRNQ